MKRGREDQAQSGGAGKRLGGGQRPGANTQTQKLTTSDALSYLREVKNRFSDDKDVYDTFLEIMKEFKAQKIDTAGVIARVRSLFKGHRELILGFNTFLPKGYEIELARISDDELEEEEDVEVAPGKGEFINKQPVEFDQAINYVNKIKNRFANDDRVYKAFLEILNMYRKGLKNIHAVYHEVEALFKNHSDLLNEFTYFLPDAQAVKDQQRRAAQQGSNFNAGVSSRQPGGGRGGSHPQATSPVLKHKRKTAQRAEEGFKAGYGFNDDVDLRKPVMARELQFFDRVKARLRGNRDGYNDLIKSIHLFNQEILSKGELLGLVSDVLGKHQDLMVGFNEFLQKCEIMDNDGRQAGPVMPPSQRDAVRRGGTAVPKDKILSKPLSEIVAHETERVTPSYVKIPSAYPRLECRGRTELDRSVLNDLYVNVITGSEDYSFKLMRKNQYEEALFRCEDDRYEFDMCIETNASALRALRPLNDRIQALSPDDRAAFRIEDGVLSPVHYKAVDTLYADSGPVLVDLLRKNPSVAIPVIIQRMEQKDAEWRKVKEEMVKVWKKIYEQNYHKSLDHRSFYFKQAEKKQLLPKTMVQEVREASDRRKEEEQPTLRCLPLSRRYEAGSEPVPDLSYDYSDRNVFDDCWSILRTAIDESVSSGPREQVLNLYLSIVEPFFCLPPRSEELTKIKAQGRTGLKTKRGMDMKCESSDQDPDGNATDGAEQGKIGASKASSPEPGEGGSAPDAPSGADTGMDEGRTPVMHEGGSAGDDGAEESSDEHPGRSYATCKPLAPYTGPEPEEASEATISAPRSDSGTTHLLLANENIYIFFRYHRHLYDRLWIARKCAMQQANLRGQQHMRPVGTPPPAAHEGSEESAQAKEAQAIREDSDYLHGTFMSMTQKMLVGELEISLFEDQVRALLGTNSYELFTLDKLVGKLIGHMRIMVQDEHTMKLWELFNYEHARSGGINHVAYHINSHSILEDTCYRVKYNDKSKVWTTTLVEPDRTEALAAPEGAVSAYIKQYVSAPAAQLPDDHQALFLLRNLAVKGQDYCEEGMAGALQQVIVHNGLECKVSCATNKVSYVLDTEDIMCRRKRTISDPRTSYRETRQGRFLQWLEGAVMRVKVDQMAAEEVAHGLVVAAAAVVQ